MFFFVSGCRVAGCFVAITRLKSRDLADGTGKMAEDIGGIFRRRDERNKAHAEALALKVRREEQARQAQQVAQPSLQAPLSVQPLASLGGALSAGPGGHRSRYDLSDSDDNDMVEEAEEVEEVGGCDDREATAAVVAAAAKAVQAAAAATWKQYLSGDTSVKSQPGRGATSAASGARLDSSRTAAHLAFSAAACAPSSTPNLPAVIAGFAANIATLLPMMNGLIASIQRVPPLRRSGRRSGRTFQSRRFSYPVTPCARCSRTRRRRGGNATEAHRASCKNPSGWRAASWCAASARSSWRTRGRRSWRTRGRPWSPC